MSSITKTYRMAGKKEKKKKTKQLQFCHASNRVLPIHLLNCFLVSKFGVDCDHQHHKLWPLHACATTMPTVSFGLYCFCRIQWIGAVHVCNIFSTIRATANNTSSTPIGIIFSHVYAEWLAFYGEILCKIAEKQHF